eukprot:m.439866 g.439866  ORF g.439866 m.439866 type:complete len:113 (-) comp18431_c0_seq1:217-555(-)
MPKEVVFDAEASGAKDGAAKAMQTGRYDRKAIKARIELEEWVDEQLRALYEMGDQDLSPDQELDLDLVWDEDAEDRQVFVQNVLGSVKDQAAVNTFITELLGRMKAVKAAGK